jgi:Rrf2 family transcriptional regulator, iron-sulfur cluster assembly transcription factor
MAMVDLAARQAETGSFGPICLSDIADRQQLSLSYLEQLFSKLRRADLVASARGPGGGYRLARPADHIAIADIVLAVDEPIKVTRCRVGSGGCMAAPGDGHRGMKCHTHDLWFELGRQLSLFLGGISLADVVSGNVAGRAVRLPDDEPARQAVD